MTVNLKTLSEAQRQALVDLIVLTIYADGHFSSVEDSRLERLLLDLGYTEAYDRQQQLDGSVTRVRQYAEAPEKTRLHAVALAKNFTNHEQRRQIYSLLEEIVTSDAHISSTESSLLDAIRGMFRL